MRPPLRRARSRQAGFTILEILIATAILVIGLLGVLALFPAGIQVGREVVEDSTAVALARSVADSIRKGIKNNRRIVIREGGTSVSYFVLQHDGVEPAPASRRRENPRAGYFILLPSHPPGRNMPGKTDAERRRIAALGKGRLGGKTFVYPETDEDGFGDPFRADDDKDDGVDEDGNERIVVTKTYPFGTTFPAMDAEGPEYLDDQKIEVVKQYSYAFSIRPSIYDANMDFLGGNFVPGDQLYHVRVMIYRSFDQNYKGEDSPLPEPIYDLDFEVSL